MMNRLKIQEQICFFSGPKKVSGPYTVKSYQWTQLKKKWGPDALKLLSKLHA